MFRNYLTSTIPMFETLHGNEPIKSYLNKALDEDRLPQTLLFAGPEGIGKSLFAQELAARALSSPLSRIPNHPDLHIVRPEGKSGLHAIDTLRELIDQIHEAPFESKRKVCIIEDAERMQAPSANALLKTLEEPPLDTVLILIASQPQEILPTILSRCIQLHFQPLSEESIGEILAAKNLSPRFAPLAHGSASTALLLASDAPFNEMQTALFQLLAVDSYLELTEGLEKIESTLEEIKEENPVAYQRRVELLFATLLMWARDQQEGVSRPFFPDLPKRALKFAPFQQKLLEARTAFQRNIKLSVCLEHVLS
ncbi:MAG: DNA polymerase III subunit delta' [Verrucomicrobia bacterium]|nr:DNA polymerase III subunit delta' [Verrucomicrobiota bacterium]